VIDTTLDQFDEDLLSDILLFRVSAPHHALFEES